MRLLSRARAGAHVEESRGASVYVCVHVYEYVPVVWVDAAGAGAELVHVGLAGQDGAAGPERGHARRVRRARPGIPQPTRPACTPRQPKQNHI